MKYDIFSRTAPAMPKPSKGTEIVKLLFSQVSKDMREPLLPMTLPALAAHLSDVNFKYCDNKYYELCGQMGHLIGPSGIGKDQLHDLVEAIMRSFRDHDEKEYKKLEDWQHQKNTKGANKDKPDRPEVAIWFPPIDVTSAAFLQNALGLEKLGGRTQYLNLPEVEMVDKMCGGHKQVSMMVRNIYDRKRVGALRATAEGVTGNPLIRANLTFSSIPEVARQFYKRDMMNGFFGRIPFAYKSRGERKGKIPRKGDFDEEFLQQLDEYLERLDNSKGRFVVKPLNRIADQLAEEMARLSDLADDDTLFELSHRSIFAAWKKGATLWILNNQTWTRSIGEFVVWFCYYDLWSKVKVFGDMFKGGDAPVDDVQRSGPKNMLDDLPDTFNEAQLEALRLSLGKSKEGTKHQLNVWKNRKFITYSNQTGLYTKTESYLKDDGKV
jgi:hypothetical protein